MKPPPGLKLAVTPWMTLLPTMSGALRNLVAASRPTFESTAAISWSQTSSPVRAFSASNVQIGGRHEHPVAVQREAHLLARRNRRRVLIAPQDLPVGRVQREHRIRDRLQEHDAVVHERRRHAAGRRASGTRHAGLRFCTFSRVISFNGLKFWPS